MPAAERAAHPQVMDIEGELIEEDPAQCQAFALEWFTKARPPSNGAITHQMARIDLAIRTKRTTRCQAKQRVSPLQGA